MAARPQAYGCERGLLNVDGKPKNERARKAMNRCQDVTSTGAAFPALVSCRPCVTSRERGQRALSNTQADVAGHRATRSEKRKHCTDGQVHT